MEESQKVSLFQKSGIYKFSNSNTVFIDPVRILNRSYNRFTVSPSTYYPRFFKNTVSTTVPASPTKRKRKKRKRSSEESRPLNDREQIALQRHQVFYFDHFQLTSKSPIHPLKS